MYKKEIKWDRETKDFAMYLDGTLVGYARSYLEGEITLNNLVHETLKHQPAPAPIKLNQGVVMDAGTQWEYVGFISCINEDGTYDIEIPVGPDHESVARSMFMTFTEYRATYSREPKLNRWKYDAA